MARPKKFTEPRKPYLVRLPPALYRDLQHYRIDAEVTTLNELVVKALTEWLAGKKRKR